MKNAIQLFLMLLIFTGILGCAMYNEGAVDLRRTNKNFEYTVQGATGGSFALTPESWNRLLLEENIPTAVLEKICLIESDSETQKDVLVRQTIDNTLKAMWLAEIIDTVAGASQTEVSTPSYEYKLEYGSPRQLKQNYPTNQKARVILNYLASFTDTTFETPEGFQKAVFIHVGDRRMGGYKRTILRKSQINFVPATDVFTPNPAFYKTLLDAGIPENVIAGLKNVETKEYESLDKLYMAIGLEDVTKLTQTQQNILKDNVKAKKKKYSSKQLAASDISDKDLVSLIKKNAANIKNDDMDQFCQELEIAVGKALIAAADTKLINEILETARKTIKIYEIKQPILDTIQGTYGMQTRIALDSLEGGSFNERELSSKITVLLRGVWTTRIEAIIKKAEYKKELNCLTPPLFQGRPFQLLSKKNATIASSAEIKNSQDIEAGDALSLYLKSAFIKEIADFISLKPSRQFGKKIGEIAIVTNAAEEQNGDELSFKDMDNGRVVFYSDNVHTGQFLNFNNMPIYGPITYGGAPFIFRISIFELDVYSEQAKSMLQTVADVGAKAYAPASPVLGILNSIGGAMLNGKQNDLEFRYVMVLDPNKGSELVTHFALEVGNYVLIREEDRGKPVPWNRLMLDDDRGQVFWKDQLDENGAFIPYKDNTYVVVEVNKDLTSPSVELSQNNYATLIASLKGADKKRADDIPSITSVLTAAALSRGHITNFYRAKQLLSTLEDKNANGAEKWARAKELLEMIATSQAQSNLSDDQVEYLLTRIRKIANVSDAAGYAKLTRENITAVFTNDGSRDDLITLITGP